MFALCAHDPAHDPEDEGALVPLTAWVEAARAGAAPFRLDPYEGVDLLLSDGDERFVQASWGEPGALARGCEVAAARLRAGQVALLRSAGMDVGTYVVFVPTGARVRCGLLEDRPPMGDVFTFHPSSLAGQSADAVDALHAWAAEIAEALVAPGPNPFYDRAHGKLTLDLATVIADLERDAAAAHAAADLLRGAQA